jgi:hypothetical protein
MARQQRTTTASFPQETPAAIARVALSPATSEQLKAMTTSEVAEEVWWSAAKRLPWRWSRMATRGFPVLLINDPTQTLMQRVKVGGANWRRVALKPHEVGRVIKQLRRIRRLGARGKEMIDCLTKHLRWGRHVGICLVQDGPDRRCRDRIVLHECFHLFQYRKRLDKHSTTKALIKHPLVAKALPHLRKRGYDVGNAVLVVSEMEAYIFSGDHAAIGLGRIEAQDWLSARIRVSTLRELRERTGRSCHEPNKVQSRSLRANIDR